MKEISTKTIFYYFIVILVLVFSAMFSSEESFLIATTTDVLCLGALLICAILFLINLISIIKSERDSSWITTIIHLIACAILILYVFRTNLFHSGSY